MVDGPKSCIMAVRDMAAPRVSYGNVSAMNLWVVKTLIPLDLHVCKYVIEIRGLDGLSGEKACDAGIWCARIGVL
jgi:hypothetical protein